MAAAARWYRCASSWRSTPPTPVATRSLVVAIRNSRARATAATETSTTCSKDGWAPVPAQRVGHDDSLGVRGRTPVGRDVDDRRGQPGRKEDVAREICVHDLRSAQRLQRTLES
jgi:hypothetical protein